MQQRLRTWFSSAATCWLLFSSSCSAAVTPELSDYDLQQNYSWAMYVEAHDVDHYLNYLGSKIHPLTRVRVRFRYFPRRLGAPSWPARTYEEFWYQEGRVVGLRRYGQVQMTPVDFGTIIVGPTDNKIPYTMAIADAIVRLMVDLQLQHVVTAGITVPTDLYDQLLVNFKRYHFSPGMEHMAGPQMGFRIVSASNERQTMLYLRF
jgi:hypothetical protein